MVQKQNRPNHSQIKMKNALTTLFLLVAVLFGSAQSQYVNPFIGTAEHGHTFPGAIVPFGGVQLSPDTRLDGWDGCSAYHYSDNRIYGFSHTHLSGTGCSDYGDILVMPFTGEPSLSNEQYSSTFSHQNETATAGYYAVKLDNGIFAELTTDQHVGLHRYTFPKSGHRGIIIDMTHRDKVLESMLTHEKDEIFGYRRSEAWNPDQYCAFSLIPSEPIQKIEYYSNGVLVADRKIAGENCKAVIYFADDVKSVTLKVAISAVDVQGARNNQKEVAGQDFNQVLAAAKRAWDKELSKISVTSKNQEQLTVFYTALYHCFTSPYLYSDIDGRYRGQDGKIHYTDGEHNMYTVFSLWDTYRTLHPLLNIIDRKRTEDFLYTFLHQYRQGGMLPVWELSAHETWCMIGYHSIPVILDAFVKGIHPYDPQEMLKAMIHSATLNRLGRQEYAQCGYVPGDADNESVSKTLEYAYDDWCIAQFAKMIGNEEVYKEYILRAQNYKNLMDADGFMHGRVNSGFVTPFNPTEVNNYYTEANSWQYSTYVPHDIRGYINNLCGDILFEKKLDSLFYGSSQMTGRNQSDITGMIGQYAHGNEPSHHAAYLYSYIGKMWKTQELTRKILTELYTTQPDGLCGNEDCGQMSAWYVMSALGFYPVCPGSNEYVFGYPIFPEASIQLENGKTLTIKKRGTQPYIQSVKWNGQPLNQWYITYAMFHEGGELEFIMGNEKPMVAYHPMGDNPSLPHSAIEEKPITRLPVFSTDKKSFSGSQRVTISYREPECAFYADRAPGYATPVTNIYYTTDGTTPTRDNGQLYQEPILVNENVTIKAVAYNNFTGYSQVAEANYIKFDKDKTLTYITEPNPQYYAGGNDGLIDGIKGKVNWRIGGWQGFPGGFEAIIDLKHSKAVNTVTVSCLEDVRAWIFFPKHIDIYISEDGSSYQLLGSADGIESVKSEDAKLHEFVVNGNASGRYLKVKVTSYGALPEWHVSAGEQSWLFMDEISVN